MSPTPTIRIETLLEHEPFVRSILRGLVQDENQVQDLVQETWVRAMRRPPKEAGAIKGWLARVAENLVRDSHRRAATRAHRENAASRPEADTSVASSEERLRLHQQIVEAVMELEEPYRGVMILTYYEDLSANEIATQLNRKPATVRSQIHRAHAYLRTMLDRDYGTRRDWMIIAAPMLKWDKPVVASATGFSLAQIAGYAAVAACLVATGLWAGDLLMNSGQDENQRTGQRSGSVLQPPAGLAKGSMGSVASTDPSKGTNGELAGNTPDSNKLTNSARASDVADAERTQPLIEWSVRVMEDGRPVEGAQVFVRMDEEGPAVPDFGVSGTWYGFYSFSDPGLFEALTGPNGKATYSLPEPPKVVLAISDSGVAGVALEADSGTEALVELSPGFAMHLQVVNGIGDPVSRVPIVIKIYENPEGRPYDTSPDSTHYEACWTLSGAGDGRAVFYGRGQLGGALIGGEKGREQNLEVQLGIPGLANEMHRVGFEQGSSIENPVRLVKPDTGSLDVRVVEPGGELTGRVGSVRLQKNHKYHADGEVWSYAKVVDGVAHFPMVAVDCGFSLTFHSPKTGVQWSAVVQGPESSGEHIVRTIQGTSTPLIRGRLVGDSGPFGNWALMSPSLCVLDSERTEIQRTPFRTKEDGTFEVAVNSDIEIGTEVSLQIVGFSWSQAGLRPRWDSEGAAVLGSKDMDLGDLEVAWVNDCVWGQVVDAKGAPVAKAFLQIDTDRPQVTSAMQTDADGKFKMHGIYPETTILTVSETLSGPKQRIEVNVMEGKALRIELPISARMEGHLVAPQAWGQYVVKVVHPDPEQRVVRPPASWANPETGRYEVVGVAAGRHLVQITLWSEVIHEIPDVLFEKGGVCSDPRVGEIDLNEHLVTWTVRVTGPSTRTPFFANCLVSGSVGSMACAGTDQSGLASFVLPKRGEWTLTVTSSGMASEEIVLSGEPPADPLIIQMKAGIGVRLICQQPPPFEKDGQRAVLSLHPIDDEGDAAGHGPSVHLPGNLLANGEGRVSFPKAGRYVLFLSRETIVSSGPVDVSAATRCTFSDLILEVKESDQGKTLDLVLPEDLFQNW